MDIAARRTWTQEEFLDWVEVQECLHEFDGLEPVEMNGGSADHNVIGFNIYRLLHDRLRGKPFRLYGQSMAMATAGDAIRYPDVFVTTAPFIGKSRLVGDPLTVFEVLSPTSVHTDRHVKLREYAAIPTIRRYVIVESESIGIEVFTRQQGNDPWSAPPLEPDATLLLPELDTQLTAAEIYEGTSHAAPP